MPNFKYDFSFYKKVRCLERCRYDRVYEVGDERELSCLIQANSEEEARRNIITHELRCGWQVLQLKLESMDTQHD